MADEPKRGRQQAERLQVHESQAPAPTDPAHGQQPQTQAHGLKVPGQETQAQPPAQVQSPPQSPAQAQQAPSQPQAQPQAQGPDHAQRLISLGVPEQDAHRTADLVRQHSLNAEALFELLQRFGPQILEVVRRLLGSGPPA